MSEYNICGVLVHSQQNDVTSVSQQLQKVAGVEVHHITDNGRLIVTIEGEQRRDVADTINRLHDIRGVLSAAMIYQFSDDVETQRMNTNQGEMQS